MSIFYEDVCRVLKTGAVRQKEDMRKHTTFRTGGPADLYVSPADEKELTGVLRLCRDQQIPYYILGNGSNLLVGDGGYDGVVISMTEGFSYLNIEGKRMTAGAGTTLSRAGRAALAASLTGFEFAAGIPGTFGGAVVMNAGAYGSELRDVLRQVKVLTPEGETRILKAEELNLGYRTSCIADNGYIVLEAALELEPGDQEAIRARMETLAEKRRSRQPLEYPSAGSTFKRPAGSFAGKLIEEAGLKGYRCGGAQVSEKHCGFVINRDHATSADILELCRKVQERVRENSGVELEMEVKKLGRF